MPSSSMSSSRVPRYDGEGVGLATGAVEGDHELTAWTFAEGVRVGQRFEAGDDIVVTATGQEDVAQVFFGG